MENQLNRISQIDDMIKEIIVVEGRDDSAAVSRAVKAAIIETHGFGIKKEVWDQLEKAYGEQGLIILTDPDYSGEEIRRKLTARFPGAKQAYIARDEALKGGDIGVENAEPDVIRQAILRARGTVTEEKTEFTMEDMDRYGLTGLTGSMEKRRCLGKLLGIGYGNTTTFLKKLNRFGITREDFIKYEAICQEHHR